MSDEFHYQRRVEFCETDAAGIAHFSAYFQYMEQAEHAFLRHLGTSVIADDEAGTISWPRVNAQCDYTDPVRFEDVLDIIVRIEPDARIPAIAWSVPSGETWDDSTGHTVDVSETP